MSLFHLPCLVLCHRQRHRFQPAEFRAGTQGFADGGRGDARESSGAFCRLEVLSVEENGLPGDFPLPQAGKEPIGETSGIGSFESTSRPIQRQETASCPLKEATGTSQQRTILPEKAVRLRAGPCFQRAARGRKSDPTAPVRTPSDTQRCLPARLQPGIANEAFPQAGNRVELLD